MTALVSVHRFSFAICSITDPSLKISGGLPREGQVTTLDVVGASVLLNVGELLLLLVGEKVGNGVGGDVVLWINCMATKTFIFSEFNRI